MRYRLTDVERLEACGQDPSWICGWVADRSDSVWLTNAVELAFERPMRIAVILVVAFLAARIVRRLIDRFGRRFARRSMARLVELERRTPRPAGSGRPPGLRRRPQDEAASPPPGEAGHGEEVMTTGAGGPVTGTGAGRPVAGGSGAGGPVAGTGADDSARAADPLSAAPGNGRLHLRIDTLVAVLASLSSAVIWAIGGVFVLGQFDVSLAPLFAGAGVLGVALGFGAQSVVADFLSGFFMLFEDQFGVGDVVDLGEASGTVESLSLRTTTVRDVNGTVWHIRNSEIRRVGNKSQLWSRAVLDVEVAYDTDVRRAEGIIQRVADELWEDADFTDADILDPPEVWGVEQVGPNGVTIRLVLKTDPAEQWIVARELRLRIKEALDEAGIEIPFPQRTVWLREGHSIPPGERPEVGTAPLRIPDATEEMAQNPD